MAFSTQCTAMLTEDRNHSARRCLGRAWHGESRCWRHREDKAQGAVQPEAVTTKFYGPLTLQRVAPELVNHPAHYNTGKIEAITVIEDWALNFNMGNCLKYLARADHKGKPIEDLKKALWYLQRELARREG